MNYRQNLGKKGEILAKKFLENKGLKFISENYHARTGEIDLIFLDAEGVYVFVEVKTRTSEKFGTTLEAVTLSKYKKMLGAIEHFFAKNLELSEIPPFRIDILGVLFAGEIPKFTHLQNIGEDCF